MASFWIFRRGGAKAWTFAWAPDQAQPAKRKQVTLPPEVKTKSQAALYARENEEQLKSGTTVARSTATTISILYEKFTKLYSKDERLAQATIGDAKSCLKTWVLPKLGDLAIDKLDVPAAREWLRWLRVQPTRGRTIAPYTVRNVVAAFAVLLDAVEAEGWARLPAGNVARSRAVRSLLPEMLPLAGRSQKLRIKETSLAQKLIDCGEVPMHRRVRYAVELTSGLRDGEELGLLWADLEIDAPVPHGTTRKAILLRHRKGQAKRGKLKTLSAERVFPIHQAAAVAALKEWKSEGWEQWVGRRPRAEDLVFPNAHGKAWRPRSAQQFREDAVLAGLPVEVDGHPLTFHALRRSFASWLNAAGVPDEIISALLGHSPRGTARKHYTEQDLPILAEHVAKIRLVWTQSCAPVASCAASEIEPCDQPVSSEKPLPLVTKRRSKKAD